MFKTLNTVWNADVIIKALKKKKIIMSDVHLTNVYLNTQKKEKRILKLLSMNCAGWNYIKL